MVALSSHRLNNTQSEVCLPSPLELHRQFPSCHLEDHIGSHRASIHNALQSVSGQSAPFLIITGPCSLHCTDAALEYGRRLADLQQKIGNNVLLVMRAYMEKPRSTLGWKGLINDPELDGSHDLFSGIAKARKLLIDLSEMGLPLAVEALNPNLVPYYQDLASWAAIGARTVESQTHREMASDLPFPVGLKNATQGCFQTAVDATQAVMHSHLHTAINEKGQLMAKTTRGNSGAHVILRGGKEGPNYSPEHIHNLHTLLKNRGLNESCIVDCSHGNSSKQADKQIEVARSVVEQAKSGATSIKGIMLESHLHSGKQALNNADTLKYGVSITDECLGWNETKALIEFIDRERPRC